MSKKVDMNVFLHFLLVIKQMNNFTVTEAKNTLLHEQSKFTDSVETRKFIYRQLTRNIKKGLLKRTNKIDDGAKKVIYSKTDLYFTVQVIPVTRGRKIKVTEEHNKQIENIDYQKELEKELLAYGMDLNTLLEEAKEYKRLITRFPKLENRLQQHHAEAKENSIKLLGKIRALQNLLGNEMTEQ